MAHLLVNQTPRCSLWREWGCSGDPRKSIPSCQGGICWEMIFFSSFFSPNPLYLVLHLFSPLMKRPWCETRTARAHLASTSRPVCLNCYPYFCIFTGVRENYLWCTNRNTITQLTAPWAFGWLRRGERRSPRRDGKPTAGTPTQNLYFEKQQPQIIKK